MATDLRGTLMAGLMAEYRLTSEPALALQRSHWSHRKSFTNGPGDGLAEILIHRSGRLKASTLELDLDAIINVFGALCSLSKVRFLIVENRTLTAGKVITLGGDWVTSIGGLPVVKPGGLVLLNAPIDGYTVTATSADVLQLDPGAETIDYEILIGGDD